MKKESPFPGSQRRVGTLCLAAGLALAAAGARPPALAAFDERSAGLGLNLSRGNSDSLNASLALDGRRRGEKSVFNAALRGAYGRTDERTSAEKAELSADFRRDISALYYWSLSGGFEHDRVARLDYRVDLGGGFGRYLVRRETSDLSVSGGLAWVVRRYRDEPAEDYPALKLSQRYERRYESGARLWQTLRWLPEISAPAVFLALFEAGVEAPFTGNSSLRLVLQNNYNSEPAPGRRKNDLVLTSYLAWRF